MVVIQLVEDFICVNSEICYELFSKVSNSVCLKMIHHIGIFLKEDVIIELYHELVASR